MAGDRVQRWNTDGCLAEKVGKVSVAALVAAAVTTGVEGEGRLVG